MQLEKHGLKLITPDVAVTALSPDGRALSLYQDAAKSAQEIAAFSQKDAAKYPEFQQSLAKISKVIAEALATTPPDIDHPSRGDLVEHAEDRARHSQAGQERYVPPAALGTDGGGRPGVGIFRDGTVAGGDRRSRSLRNISRPMVGGKRAGAC